MAQERSIQSVPTPRLQPPPGRRRSSRTLSIPSDGPPYGIKTEPTTVITPPSSPRYPTHLSIKRKKKPARFYHLSPVVRNRVIVVLASPVIFVGVGLGLIVLIILLGLFIILLPFGIGLSPLQAVKTRAVDLYEGIRPKAVEDGGSKTEPAKKQVPTTEAVKDRGSYAEVVKAGRKELKTDKGQGDGSKVEWEKRHEDMRELNRKRSEVEMKGDKGDGRKSEVSVLEVPAEEFDSCDVSSGFQF